MPHLIDRLANGHVHFSARTAEKSCMPVTKRSKRSCHILAKYQKAYCVRIPFNRPIKIKVLINPSSISLRQISRDSSSVCAESDDGKRLTINRYSLILIIGCYFFASQWECEFIGLVDNSRQVYASREFLKRFSIAKKKFQRIFFFRLSHHNTQPNEENNVRRLGNGKRLQNFYDHFIFSRLHSMNVYTLVTSLFSSSVVHEWHGKLHERFVATQTTCVVMYNARSCTLPREFIMNSRIIHTGEKLSIAEE